MCHGSTRVLGGFCEGNQIWLPSCGHIAMNHENQKIILCEEGQAK